MRKIKTIILRILKMLGTVLTVLLGTVGTLVCFSVAWMFRTWSNLTVDEMIYHLTAPLEGTNEGLIQSYLNECAVPAILMLIFLLVLFIALQKRKAYVVALLAVISLSILISGIFVSNAWKKLDVGDYVSGQSKYSTFIDDNYIDPADVEITFPEKKRNLIYIFLESMETTYADIESGGGFEENVIPELTELAKENEDFSGEDGKLNGAYALPGTTWTMGAMVGHTAGIPLNIPIQGNNMDTQDSFFANAIALGDILEKEGYAQTLFIGSEAEFGGRKLYFTDHGNYKMKDYNSAINTGLLPEDYRVGWGYEDFQLFAFAKEELQEISKKSIPFNFTMLTVDTHFEDGYPCKFCPDTFGDDTYANVMSCSSRQTSEFIRWIKDQDFYENTTVVVVGDHLTMDSDFCDNINEKYQRKVYTNYINAVTNTDVQKKRVYTTLDFFPTTLASIGAEIIGEKMGLGTNLFSSKPTLAEQVGVNELNKKITEKSKLLQELAEVNFNKKDLVVREGKKEQEGVTAVVTAGTYEFVKGVLPVSVSEVKGLGDDIKSLSLAVWTDKEQKDLQWIPLEKMEEGKYYGNIDVPRFGYKTGEYQIQVYGLNGAEEAFFVSQTVGIVE